jgi:nucleotide-binding universal stress UspA family protein
MSFPFERILLATEHTEFDVGAERVAFAVARQPGVTLSAVIPMVSNVEYETVAPELVLAAEEAAFARSAEVRAAAADAGLNVEVRVRRADEPWRAIVAEAHERQADLLIIRRRGRRGFLAKLMVGEMVDKVVTAAPCHALIVPRAAGPGTRRVVAGIDHTRAGPVVAQSAGAMAAAAGIPLTLVCVATDATPAAGDAAQAAIAAATDIARAAGAHVEGRVAQGRAADVVAELTAALGADLVVVGRGGPETHGLRLRLGGNAHRIVGRVSCAVLVIKP